MSSDSVHRLSEGAVRLLLFGAIVAHGVMVVVFCYYLWTHISQGLSLFVGFLVTCTWVVWLRAVEFNRAFPRELDAPMRGQRYRAPDPVREDNAPY